MTNTRWISYSMIGIALLVGHVDAQQTNPYRPIYLRRAFDDVSTIPWKYILRSADDDWVVAHIYPSADSGDEVDPSAVTGIKPIKLDNGYSFIPLPIVVAGTAHVAWLFIDRKETLDYQFERNPIYASGPIRWLNLYGQKTVILFRVKGELADNFHPYPDARSLGMRRLQTSRQLNS